MTESRRNMPGAV